jgi:hypothetical protein
VDVDGDRVYFEVKEFGRPQPVAPGGHSPLPYVTRKIKKAREKFEQYQDRCCALVLYNHASIALCLSPHLVLSAMFGEYRQRHSDHGVVFSGAAELRADKNTRLSTIITLRPLHLGQFTIAVGAAWHDQQRTLRRPLTETEVDAISNRVMQRGLQTETTVFRATVLANPHANQQLPSRLFRGPFDEWWQQRADRMACTFRGARLQKLWDVLPEYALTALSGRY